MKAGFVNIFGKPNAGKSTLLNAFMGEKLAIVSPKVQTTRHRIKGILTEPGYQIIFSDTPGIIEPRYKLHEKMMQAVKSALEDADLALLMVDVYDDYTESDAIFTALRLKAPALLVLNKVDGKGKAKAAAAREFFTGKSYVKQIVEVSALQKEGVPELLQTIVDLLPEGEPFFDEDNLTDLPTRFFVGELIREQIYQLYQDEIPYHAAVLVQEFKEKSTLIKIMADIIVQRDTQKGIILGEKGKMIRELGTRARAEIEQFLGQKVFLELFVKVRPKWRDNDLHLREYGYN
ncbi:GTPase Era [Flavihumibacter petaseus]|uniref:GTPase Era n=1 Tax=Flavihumibacter petaseus NBRC 106054 TaxID=1220578 RepID=A0A0E9N7E0_9BACT|nr:GTPase Era [Flavihumibacter petaseus]GAO45718.1 GTPase Era [Flavihumibacter petaseus NBRC 106054]